MIRRALLTAAVGLPLAALVALLTIFLRVVLAAPETARSGGTYTEGMVGTLLALNPLYPNQDANGHDADALLFEPLVSVGPRGLVTGLLSSRWDISQDQRSYIFTLRPNARWSDGSAVTASDVVFTIRTIQNPDYPGQVLSASWKDIVATELDPTHVRFTLPGRNASFMATLGQLEIVPAHLLAGKAMGEVAGPAVTGQPVGSGPFQISQRLSDRIILLRNPFTWRRPWIDTVVLRFFPTQAAALDALDRGQIDGLAGLGASAITREAHNPQVVLHTTGTYQYTELLFNLKPDVALFQDKQVRKAIAKAIDRTAIIRDVLKGQARPAVGPIPESITWAFDAAASPPTYDPTAAANLLDAAGWARQPDGSRMHAGATLGFQLVVASDLPPYRAVAQQVADQLAQVGVDVTVQPEPTAVLIHDALNPRTFQMALTAFDNGPDPDVFPFWHSTQAHPGGFNFVSMRRNVFIDKDLEDGRASLDLPTRAKAYADLQELFAEEVPAVYLYSPTYTFAISSRIHGVQIDPAIEPDQRFAHVDQWYIEAGR
ncbi:MAG TPA: peptide ABC transporter substrate-binding protein [Candidatus Limnocylindrales bacterium]|nr:peptide ABC transporter substrate-binding protein [Candidatus Limnocylindrales bacterium]